MAMIEEMTKEQRTHEIERCYNRGVNGALRALLEAKEKAKAYVMPSGTDGSQMQFIDRLEKLEHALREGAQNPLGDFNWDFV